MTNKCRASSPCPPSECTCGFYDSAMSDKARLLAIHERFDNQPSRQTFNRLTPRQNELLAMLSEEASEVIQIKEKIVRHGLESYHPQHPERGDNRAMLAREIGDLLGVVDELIKQGIVDQSAINIYRESKMRRSAQYLHHQKVRTNE